MRLWAHVLISDIIPDMADVQLLYEIYPLVIQNQS
jgi:hypothetical protein